MPGGPDGGWDGRPLQSCYFVEQYLVSKQRRACIITKMISLESLFPSWLPGETLQQRNARRKLCSFGEALLRTLSNGSPVRQLRRIWFIPRPRQDLKILG